MTVSIISSIIIWGSVLFIIMRILTASGLCLPQNKITDFISDDKRIQISCVPSRNKLLAVFSAAFAFRIIVILMSAGAIYMFSDNQASFTDFLNQYMEWDANNYIRIATGGYTYHVEEGVYTTLAFFSAVFMADTVCKHYISQSAIYGTFLVVALLQRRMRIFI